MHEYSIHALLIAATLVFPVASSADARQLFNGKDLSGWLGKAQRVFRVRGGPRGPALDALPTEDQQTGRRVSLVPAIWE